MKVYFNGSCNICNAEISHYKKKTCNINYVDISKNKDEHINHLSKKDLFRRMHDIMMEKFFLDQSPF